LAKKLKIATTGNSNLPSNISEITALGSALNPGFNGLAGLPLGTWSVQNGRIGYWTTNKSWEKVDDIDGGAGIHLHGVYSSSFNEVSSNTGSIFSQIWNSELVRAIVPDNINLGGGFNIVVGYGGGVNWSINLLTRGPDAGFHSTITPTQRFGFDGGFSLTLGFNSFHGEVDAITANSLYGRTNDYSAGFGAYSAGYTWSPGSVWTGYNFGLSLGVENLLIPTSSYGYGNTSHGY